MDIQQVEAQLQRAERAAVDTNRPAEQRQLAAQDAQALAKLLSDLQAQAAEDPPRPRTTMAQEVMSGVLRPLQLPEQVTSPLGLAPPPETLGQSYLQGAGEAAGMVMAATPLLRAGRAGAGLLSGAIQRGAPAAAQPLGQSQSIAGRIGQGIQRQYQDRPRRFLAGEVAAGGGAGAGMELGRGSAEQRGVDPTAPEAIGGLVGGGLLGLGVEATGGIGRTGVALTDRVFGSAARAGSGLRGASASPEDAAGSIGMYQQDEQLRRLTPARLTDDPGLLAAEQQILAQNPRLAATVERERRGVQEEITEQGRTLFGNTRNPIEWERDMFQFAAAPGAEITATNTPNMLSQAVSSFGPAYDQFRQMPVPPNILRTLGADIESAIAGVAAGRTAGSERPSTAGRTAEDRVRDFINSQLQSAQSNFETTGQLTTSQLFDIRSAARMERRRLADSRSADRVDEAEILGRVEQTLTDRISESLGPELADRMRAVDNQYRKYKIIEDAVIKSGEGSLSPQAVSKAIEQASTSPTRYGTGEVDMDFRSLALTGAPVENLLADPETARKAMMGRTRGEINAIKGNVANYIFDRATVAEGEKSTVWGERILRQLNQDGQTAALKRLGFNETDITRMRDIANRLVITQRSATRITQDMLDDDASIMTNLVASLGAVQTARNVVDAIGFDTGVGQLVIAQQFSNVTRRRLRNLTIGQKVKLLEAATVDGELYRALLLRGDASTRQVRDAETALNAWFATVAGGAVEREVEGGVEQVEGMFLQPDSTLTPGFEPPAPQGMMP